MIPVNRGPGKNSDGNRLFTGLDPHEQEETIMIFRMHRMRRGDESLPIINSHDYR